MAKALFNLTFMNMIKLTSFVVLGSLFFTGSSFATKRKAFDSITRTAERESNSWSDLFKKANLATAKERILLISKFSEFKEIPSFTAEFLLQWLFQAYRTVPESNHSELILLLVSNQKFLIGFKDLLESSSIPKRASYLQLVGDTFKTFYKNKIPMPFGPDRFSREMIQVGKILEDYNFLKEALHVFYLATHQKDFSEIRKKHILEGSSYWLPLGFKAYLEGLTPRPANPPLDSSLESVSVQ